MTLRTRLNKLRYIGSIVGIILLFACIASAATGNITAKPCHLVIDSDQLGSTTVSWSTNGTASAQVWVSTDGGKEVLINDEASGSVDVNWIQSEKIYIFSLYEGNSHSKLLGWMSVTSHKPPASNFGFNYWPYKGSHHNLIDTKWTQAMKEEVEKDLDVMASFGCRTLRLMFWPHYCGYMIDPNNGGGNFTSDFDQIRKNLIEMLGFCAERDIKVVVASGNSYVYGKPPLWQSAYGEDFDSFLRDSATWSNGIIQSIENSKYSSTVIYYDLYNEISDVRIKMWPYIRFLYDNCSIPKGKYGISILRTAKDTVILKTELGERRMDYVEFHSYPDLTYANNCDLQTAYKIVTESFPDSTIVIGEYGGMGPDPCNLYPTTIEPSTERTQQVTETGLVKWVHDVQLPYYLHWMLWDRTPEGADNQIAAWGYKHHEPKDIMGKMADILGIITNADMENVSGIQPANWTANGTVPVTLIHYSDSATNLLCARLTVEQPSGSVWMESDSVAVEGGQKLFLNCYVRASMDNIYMSVKEYDNIKNLIKTNMGSDFSPSRAF